MLIQFTLSMPSNSSWNGKWSGEGKLYAIVKSSRAEKYMQPILERGYWSYTFGDGWTAGVSAKEIDAATARKVRKQSRGFCGYDWMVDSILAHNEIYGPARPRQEAN